MYGLRVQPSVVCILLGVRKCLMVARLSSGGFKKILRAESQV